MKINVNNTFYALFNQTETVQKTPLKPNFCLTAIRKHINIDRYSVDYSFAFVFTWHGIV